MTEEVRPPVSAEIPEANHESDSSVSSSDPAVIALGEYCPFIADVPVTSFAEPFPIPFPDLRTDREIEVAKKGLKNVVKQKTFDPPLPLADFCLIAVERWDRSEGNEEASSACLLL